MSTRKRLISSHVDDDLSVSLTLGYGRSSFDSVSVRIKGQRPLEVTVRGMLDREALESLRAIVPCEDSFNRIYEFLADLYAKVDT